MSIYWCNKKSFAIFLNYRYRNLILIFLIIFFLSMALIRHWTETIINKLFYFKIIENSHFSCISTSHNFIIIKPWVICIYFFLFDSLELRQLLETSFLKFPNFPVVWPRCAYLIRILWIKWYFLYFLTLKFKWWNYFFFLMCPFINDSFAWQVLWILRLPFKIYKLITDNNGNIFRIFTKSKWLNNFLIGIEYFFPKKSIRQSIR
jgi:hypothetical protein